MTEPELPAVQAVPRSATAVADPIEAVEAPSPEARVVQEASAWSKYWKPFLTDSVGWFVGGFLILAGIYYLVADAWDGMTSLTRAGTVFGLAAGWTLSFFAWATFLGRREATAPAGRMLERLAAAMAPLATVAVGPISDAPLVFWPLVIGWAAVAGFLAARATARVDRSSAPALAVAFALSAVMMGVAPLVASWGVNATWLTALPVGIAAWCFSSGSRSEESANRFLVASLAWAITLFAVRLEVALVMAQHPLTLILLAPMLAVAVASVRWLAKPPTRAADAWSVLVVVAQVGLLVASIDLFSPKPAFVVTALVGAWTAWSLAKERVTLASARWLPVAYAFAYLAYQRIDQLVPEVVRQAYGALKAQLGYSTAPLPASYGSVYSALFIVVVGALALRRSTSQDELARREGTVLLDTTAVATGLSSLLALVSVGTDPRPAVLATPVLALSAAVFAWRSKRLHLTIAAVSASLSAGAAFALGLEITWVMGAVALALALAGTRTEKAHQLTLLLGGGLAGLWGVAAGTMATPTLGAVLTVALSSAALMVIAIQSTRDDLVELAWAGPLLTISVAMRWLHPGFEPLVLAMASTGLAAAGLLGKGGRAGWRRPFVLVATLVMAGAISAVVWQLLSPDSPIAPGVTMLVSALGLFTLSRTLTGWVATAAESIASALALATLWPQGLLPWPSPYVPQLIAAGVVLLASVMTVLRGRAWRWGWIAGVGAFMALCCWPNPPELAFWLSVAIVLVATVALVPEVTIPVAALLAGAAFVQHHPSHELPTLFTLEATVLAALGLLDRLDPVRRVIGRGLAWPGVAMSALALAPALVLRPTFTWLPAVASVAVPVLWSLSTKRPGARLFATALFSAAIFWVGHDAAFLAPVVALGVGFSLRTTGTRDLILDRLTLFVTVTAALLVSLGAVEATASPWMPLAWAAALAVLPVGALAARLIAMAGLCAIVPSPELALVSAAVLFLLSVALRHAPELAARLLGARSSEFAQPLAACSALALTALVSVRFPSAQTQAAVVVALLLTTLLTGFSWLAAAAAVTASIDLPAVVRDGALSLHPWAVWVALGSGLLAMVLRRGFALEAIEEAWDRLGTAGKHLDRAVWWGAAATIALALKSPSLLWLAPAAVLLVTPSRVESVIGTGLLTAMLVVALPLPTAGVLIGLLGAAFAWLGATGESEAASTRLHVGWLLALGALGLTADLHAWQMPVCWSLAAVTAWAVVRAVPVLRWAGWIVTWAASHAVLAWAGIALSDGAPKTLILPWFALASVLVAIVPALRHAVPQHRSVGVVLRLLSIVELALGMVACPGGHGREAAAVVAAVGVSLWLAVLDAREDRARGVWLGAVALSCGGVLTHVLASGEGGVGESVGAVVIAALASGVAATIAASLPAVSKALRQVAVWWPVLGLVTMPWTSASMSAGVLVAFAVHYAVLAQSEGFKASAAILSAASFNGAVLTLWFGAGWGETQYVLVPIGLSGLVLVRIFADELGDVWSARLRALAVAVVYGAAAFRPLAIDATWAFLLCVTLCVVGVAAGIALRVRSFVTLGTAFLVTTVVATLIRWGVREPRLGAVFLSALGLAVVAFMVVVTTKKHELLERYKRVRGALERWDG